MEHASPSDINTNSLLKILGRALQAVASVKDNPAVLVLGNTGSGKSSTIAKFVGCDIARVGRGILSRVEIKQKIPGKAVPKIGNGSESCTLYPEIYLSQPAGMPALSFIDTPGFEDTRSITKKTAAAISMQIAIKRVQEIRAVIVVISLPELEAGRGEMLRALFATLQKIFKNPEQIGHSVLFVFTKISQESLEKESEYRYTQQMLFQQLKDSLKRTESEIETLVQSINLPSAAQSQEEGFGREILEKNRHFDELQGRSSILKLMLQQIRSAEDIILVDPLDSGKTSLRVHHMISTMRPLEKREFVFDPHSGLHLAFRHLMFDLAREGTQVLRQLVELPKRIEYFSKHCQRFRACLDGSANKIVAVLKTPQDTDAITEDLLSLQVRTVTLKEQRDEIDHDNPVEFVTFCGPHYSATRSEYDLFGLTKIPFIYRGIPFVAVRQEGDNGHFEYDPTTAEKTHYDPQNGVYTNEFIPERGKKGEPRVVILVASRKRPDNAQRIADINQELAEIAAQMETLRRVNQLVLNFEKMRQEIAEISSEITKDQRQLEAAQRHYQKQQSYYELVVQLAREINFESALINTFSLLYEHFISGKSIEFDINIQKILCPISGEVMHDAVSTKCGHTFERKALIARFGEMQETHCPCCSTVIHKGEEKQNLLIAEVIRKFEEQRLRELTEALGEKGENESRALENHSAGAEAFVPDRVQVVWKEKCLRVRAAFHTDEGATDALAELNAMMQAEATATVTV